jgi:hypothetical protein
MPFSHADVVARRHRTTGPKETVVLACSSGGAALGLAAEMIGAGTVPLALAGGVDAMTRICFMGFNALKLLDPEPCRPFALDRRGMSLGEGAGFVVLEAEAHARARGARGYAELVSYGLTTDAWHLTAPHPDGEGSVRAMAEALERAGVPASAVGYVNAHGTGTLQNDRAEAAALRKLFDPDAVLVSANKSLGRPRGDRDGDDARPRRRPAHRQPGPAGPGGRLRLRAQRPARCRGRVRPVELLRVRRPEPEPAVPARRGSPESRCQLSAATAPRPGSWCPASAA